MEQSSRYAKIFDNELQYWIQGLTDYQGEVFPGLVHGVIQKLKPLVQGALKNGYRFDVFKIASDFSKAAKYLIHEQEVAYGIVTLFPPPEELPSAGQELMFEMIKSVEREYGPLLHRLEGKWEYDRIR